jgi:hypothetical protein
MSEVGVTHRVAFMVPHIDGVVTLRAALVDNNVVL